MIEINSKTDFRKFKFVFTRQKKVGRLDCRDRFYSEPTGQNCNNSKQKLHIADIHSDIHTIYDLILKSIMNNS